MAALTLHPEVDAVLEPLRVGLKEILGNDLVGIYIFGSLAAGGFDRESDVDLLVATRQDLSDDQFERLKSLHRRIALVDSWCAVQIEVTYIPLAALRRYDPAANVHVTLERGEGQALCRMKHDRDGVVHRHILRQEGISLLGPPPQELVDPVSLEDLRTAMQFFLDGWLAHLHKTPEEVRSRGYQAYLVLTVCRVLYTLATGAVVSKPAAAEWAKQALDPRWAPLIECAWLGRQHPKDVVTPGDSDLRATFAFIQYALETAPKLQSEV